MQSKDESSSNLKNISSDKVQPENVDQSKGARPKIRNPKEAKRRRFVMKQAKTISKPQLLESVSESEEGQALLPKQQQQQQQQEPTRQEFFGVRSYVHTFYEAMAMDNPQGYEDIECYKMPLQKRRKEVICWRLMLVTGLFFLLTGVIALLVGFLVPKKREVVDTQEDIQIIDREDQAFNKDLDICKIVGTVLFCIGGLILTAVLLALNWMLKITTEDPFEEEIPMTTTGKEGPSAPIDVKVPATEELTAVQPKRVDPDEVVMTNAGLCKIP